jgi:hypothetical protein
VARWPEILGAARAAGIVGDPRLPKSPKLLGTSHKVELGEALGVLTPVLYLSPAASSGRDLCPWAGACARICLGGTPDEDGVGGSGRFYVNRDHCANAKLWKTALLYGDRDLFLEILDYEIESLERKARKLGMVPAVRLDGTSDLGLARSVAPRHPGVTFYDYSKSVRRALDNAAGKHPANWHVTFSRSESNDSDARRVLAAGGNVAVVFAVEPCAAFNGHKAEALPATWHGFPVLDGDESDVRFVDPPGSVVGLRFKGSPSSRKDWARALEAAGDFVARPASSSLPVAA